MEGIICMRCRQSNTDTEAFYPNVWCETCGGWADGYKLMPFDWGLEYCNDPFHKGYTKHINGRCVECLEWPQPRNAVADVLFDQQMGRVL